MSPNKCHGSRCLLTDSLSVCHVSRLALVEQTFDQVAFRPGSDELGHQNKLVLMASSLFSKAIDRPDTSLDPERFAIAFVVQRFCLAEKKLDSLLVARV